MLYRMQKERIYGGYCRSCDDCRKPEHCTPSDCVIELLKNRAEECDYGETNTKEVLIWYWIGKELYDKIDSEGSEELRKFAGETRRRYHVLAEGWFERK